VSKNLDREKLKNIEHDVSSHNDHENQDQWFRVTAIIGGIIFGIGISFFLWSEIIALITFHWLPPSKNITALPQAISNFPSHLGDPQKAWPVALQKHLPGKFLFVPLLLILAGAEGYYLFKAYKWWKARDDKEERGGTQWATDKELSVITNTKKYPQLSQGVVLGISGSKKTLRLEPDNHALVVAGTRSGKTAGLCIPALLTFPGVVIATSVKDDLVKHTIKQRQKMGTVFVFDPVGAMGLPEDEVAGWTPLDRSREWRDAQRTAAALIDVAMSQGGGGGNMDFFKRMSQQTLPVLLYAAAVMDEDMRRVVRWLMRINDPNTHSEIDSILRWKKNSKALDAWVGFVTKDQKLRGDIAATIASALVSYEDEKVQDNAMRCDITPEKLFDGGAHTLYVVAPMAEQARLEPVFVALMQSLLLWVTEQKQDLQTPLLCVLDEAANIAALPQLPNILSTIGSKHVQIITSWQDFSQIKDRYGDKKNTILNNSRGKLILPGVADPETLQYFSQVTGDTIEETVSVSKPQQGQKSYSFGEGRRTLLDAATIRQQQLGEAILVYGHLPPAKIKLRMYFKEPALLAMASGQTASKVMFGPMAVGFKVMQLVSGPLRAISSALPSIPALGPGRKQKALTASPMMAALPPAPYLEEDDEEDYNYDLEVKEQESPVVPPKTPQSPVSAAQGDLESFGPVEPFGAPEPFLPPGDTPAPPRRRRRA
jgi:type IV secretion system protein VirD4